MLEGAYSMEQPQDAGCSFLRISAAAQTYIAQK